MSNICMHRAKYKCIFGIPTGFEDSLVSPNFNSIAKRFTEPACLDILKFHRGHISIRQSHMNFVLDRGPAQGTERCTPPLVYRCRTANNRQHPFCFGRICQAVHDFSIIDDRFHFMKVFSHYGSRALASLETIRGGIKRFAPPILRKHIPSCVQIRKIVVKNKIHRCRQASKLLSAPTASFQCGHVCGNECRSGCAINGERGSYQTEDMRGPIRGKRVSGEGNQSNSINDVLVRFTFNHHLHNSIS